ncbi:MAG: DUF4124 domain-containing protein [Burkholderiales bacterium]|nr:DUF4124 domain-containing protein [Burkholderiales bacterium]
MSPTAAGAWAIAIVLGLASLPGLAQTVFKYVTPDGRTLYSDRPVPGARLVEAFAPPPPTTPAPSAAPKAPASRADATAKAAPDRTQGLDAAWREFNDAAAALQEANRRLEAGREELPGERLGTVRRGAGGQPLTRLTDEYWARQSANEDAVAKAQERLDKARAAWEAVR